MAPSHDEICAKTLEKFGKTPCLLQIKICSALLQRKKHVVCSASTGFGKTLTFMMPLLFDETGIMIVVTALNVLGKQNVKTLESVGIPGIARQIIPRHSRYVAIYIWSFLIFTLPIQRIKAGEFQFIVIGPEILMQKKGHFEKLWKDKTFSSKIMSVVFDEAHCISKWGSFRPEYKEVGNL
jgi:superfamily II DNA helicase RecQ